METTGVAAARRARTVHARSMNRIYSTYGNRSGSIGGAILCKRSRGRALRATIEGPCRYASRDDVIKKIRRLDASPAGRYGDSRDPTTIKSTMLIRGVHILILTKY